MVGGGVGLLQVLGDADQLCLRLFARYARLQAALHLKKPIGAVFHRVRRDRAETLHHRQRGVEGWMNVEVHAEEGFRSDADDLKIDSVHTNRASENAGIAGKLVHPLVVAQQGDRVASRDLGLVRRERTAKHGLDPHRAEEIVADQHPHAHLRLDVRRWCEADCI